MSDETQKTLGFYYTRFALSMNRQPAALLQTFYSLKVQRDLLNVMLFPHENGYPEDKVSEYSKDSPEYEAILILLEILNRGQCIAREHLQTPFAEAKKIWHENTMQDTTTHEIDDTLPARETFAEGTLGHLLGKLDLPEGGNVDALLSAKTVQEQLPILSLMRLAQELGNETNLFASLIEKLDKGQLITADDLHGKAPLITLQPTLAERSGGWLGFVDSQPTPGWVKG